jgi:hypothetical protein
MQNHRYGPNEIREAKANVAHGKFVATQAERGCARKWVRGIEGYGSEVGAAYLEVVVRQEKTLRK